MDDRTDPPLPPFAALRAFEMYGRVGGVRRAAERLGVGHAIVSRQLRALETWLGTVLIDRHTRELTPMGVAYHSKLSAGLGLLRAATVDVRSVETRLRLWCAPGLAYLWLLPRLQAASAVNRDVFLDVRPSEVPARFGVDGADAEVRFVLDGDDIVNVGLRGETLFRPEVIAVAHPTLAARIAVEAETAADLARWPLLHEQDEREWAAWLGAQGAAEVTLPPAGHLWHAHMVLAAAREGHGIALSNHVLAHDDLASGRLVRVDLASRPLRPVTLGTYMFIMSADRWQVPAFVRLRRWLAEALNYNGQ